MQLSSLDGDEIERLAKELPASFVQKLLAARGSSLSSVRRFHGHWLHRLQRASPRVGNASSA